MRRADRLFQIIQLLRLSRVVTARRLAAELEVSERTIYRDVQDLVLSGVPIDGEAGVGYMLRGYDLPPLMFTRDEVEALVLGTRIVQRWADPKLAQAAKQALDKVEAVLPAGKDHLVRETALFAPQGYGPVEVSIDLAGLRDAVRQSRKVHFSYCDAEGAETERTVRPLGMALYGPVWLLAAWCELRTDFRSFRPDRMEEMRVLDERFTPDAETSLEGFLAAVRRAAEGHE
ncbi:MAG: YafY family transcriptional regulator [bacterium]|nr:YafY family transcriptional regulator [bacterium]